mmetsp:Transcript_10177/g.14834  ORF Transcript_10177/g.14834 Transcript_10177/m.14834 type:complete len:87 (+) Transcript_10177:392-652(+)
MPWIFRERRKMDGTDVQSHIFDKEWEIFWKHTAEKNILFAEEECSKDPKFIPMSSFVSVCGPEVEGEKKAQYKTKYILSQFKGIEQ